MTFALLTAVAGGESDGLIEVVGEGETSIVRLYLGSLVLGAWYEDPASSASDSTDGAD